MESTETAVAYELEGTMLEACDCDILCPCWVGEDPDGGDCRAAIAYHLDRGTVRGVDVSGLTVASVAYIPGNIFAGGWKVVSLIDERANEQQVQALVEAFTGQLGGPLSDLAELIGEVVAVLQVPISYTIVEGKGTLSVGDGALVAEMEPFRGPDGSPTTLRESAFSTVPGSPAYVGKTDRLSVDLPEQGMEWSVEGRNAIQSDWKLVHEG